MLSAIAVSGLSLDEPLYTRPGEEDEDLTSFQITLFIIFLIFSILFLLYHFLEAWKVRMFLKNCSRLSGILFPL